MKSFTQLRNLFGSLTNDTNSTLLTLGDQLINDGIRLVLGGFSWFFLEKTSNITTVASQQAYDLPNDFHKLINVYVTQGTTVYTPKEAPNRIFWDYLNNSTTITSNIPDWFYIFDGTISFFPIPSDATDTITLVYQRTQRDLLIADYTTGTIITATNGSAAIVGNATVWTKNMEGRYLRITRADAANTGDGNWYEIETYTSATAISLKKLYLGNSITGGTASYTIGEMCLIPEPYDVLPVWHALAEYWDLQGETTRSNKYLERFKDGLKQMRNDFGAKSTSPGTKPYSPDSQFNPNLFVRL